MRPVSSCKLGSSQTHHSEASYILEGDIQLATILVSSSSEAVWHRLVPVNHEIHINLKDIRKCWSE